MKICIDAGHYKNYNPGAVKGYYEGNVVWKITELQKKYLEEYKNVTVILTRSNIAKDLALETRGGKSKGCDLFISNHSNACDKESVDRPVIIYAFDNKNKADVLGKKLGKALQDVMGTKQAYQMMQRKLPNRNNEYYGVMRGARNVGCPLYYIIEHGFHSNKATCNWLLNDNNLDKLVKAEVEVIAKHFGLVKKTASSTTTPSTTVSYTVVVDTNVLNVRKDAGTSHPITGTVKKGEKCTIVEEKNGWGKLKSGLGWISLAYTVKSSTNTSSTSSNYTVRVTANTLNVRKGAGTSYAVTGQIKKGEVYTIVEEKNNWGKLKSGLGWISLAYTKKVK